MSDTTLRNVKLQLQVDGAGWSSGLRAGASAVNAFSSTTTRALADAELKFKKIQAAMASIPKAAIPLVAAGAGVALALGLSIGAAIEFETAFSGVKKTVDGSVEVLDGLRTGLIDMSKVMPTSASDLAAIAESAGQLGVKAGDVLEFTRVVAMLGETTDLGFEQAASEIAQFLNITGSATSTVGDLASTISFLGNNSATTESKIVTFGKRLAAAGTLLGLTDQSILGVAAAFSSMGVEAEAGGTAISRVFKALYEASLGSPQLEKMAEVAGLTADAFQELIQSNPEAAFEALVHGLGQIDANGGNTIATLNDLGFEGERLQAVLLAGAQNADRMSESLRNANDSYGGTATIDEYGKKTETTAARIDILRNNLAALQITIGSVALGFIAGSADLVTKAIQGLSDILGPAISEIAEFAGGIASAGVSMIGFFGSPVLKTAGAVLLGLATGLEGIFGILNAFGPVLEYGTAAVGLFFLAWKAGSLTTVGTTLGVIAIDMAAMGPAGFTAATGISAMNVALVASPLIIVTAGLVALGLALRAASKHAKEAGDEISAGFNVALERGDFTAIKAQVLAAGNQIETLRDQSVYGAEGFDKLARTAKGAFEIFTFGENTVANANAELKAVAGAVNDSDQSYARMAVTISKLAETYGVTDQSMYNTIDTLGLLDLAYTDDAATLFFLIDEVDRAVAGHEAFADATGVTMDAIRDKTATLEDYGDELGITGDQVEYLVNQLDDVDLKDLFDEEEAARASAAVSLLSIIYGELAASVGITRQRFIEQRQSSDDLVASLGALDAATSRITDRQAALQKAMNLAAEGQTAFNTAMAAGDIEGAAVAMGEYTTALASSGVSANDVKSSQIDMRAAFEETAKAAGLSTEEIGRLLVEYGLLSEQEIAELSIAGLDLIDEAITVIADLQYGLDEAFSREYIAQLSAETGIAEEDIARAIVLGEDWATSLFEAAISGDPTDANRAFQEALAAGQDWALSIFAAALGLDADEAEDKIEDVRDQLGDLSSDEFATVLGLDTDEATRLLEAFLNSIPTSRTVSIAVGVNGPQQYKPDVSYSADGNIFEAYRNGGVRRENHVAQIAQGRTPYRVWAEPETGGEAYIPLSPLKRARSIPIWRETGKRLGVSSFADGGLVEAFANGGMSQAQFTSSVNLPTISLLVSVDTDALGALSVSLGPAASAINIAGKALEDATDSGDRLHDVLIHTVPIFYEAGQATDDLNDGLAELPVQFEATATAAERTGRAMLESLRPQEFLATFSRISGWAETELVSWLGPWDGSVSDALRTLDAAGVEMGHIFTQVAVEGARTAESMYESFASSGRDMTQAAQETGRAMLLALDPDAFITTFSRISGWASESFRQWLGDWDGTVSDALRILDSAGMEMGHIFTQVAEEGVRSSQSMYDAFASAGGEMVRVAQETGREMLLALDTDAFLATFSRISGWASDSFVEWLGDWDGTVAEAIRILDDAGMEMGHIFTTMFEEGASATEILLVGLSDVARATGEVEDAARNAATAYGLLSDVALDGLKSQFDYLDAVERVAEAIGEGEAFDKLSQATRRNYEDLIRAGEKMADYGISIAESGASADEAVKAYADLRAGFVDLATAAGLPQDEIQTLADLLFSLPEQVIAEIAVEGEEARIELDEVKKLLGLFDEITSTAVLEVNADEARTAIIMAHLDAVEFAQEEYEASLKADPTEAQQATIDAAAAALEFALEEYEAALTADSSGAETSVIRVTESTVLYADGHYEADIDADPTNAVEAGLTATQKSRLFADGSYLAYLDGDNTNAIASATTAQTKAVGFATSRYNATLTATDSASSVIGRAISSLASFVSKNVTLTTTYKTVGSPSTYVPPKAGDGGVRYSAAGNLFSSVGDFANSHMPEIVPAGTWRVFAEDETGGEAYLPLANDWRRPGAVDILGQVADQFGFGLTQLAAGGMSHVMAGNNRTISAAPIIQIAAGAVQLSVEVPLGADAKQVGDIAKAAVAEGLNSFTRDLADVAGSYR